MAHREQRKAAGRTDEHARMNLEKGRRSADQEPRRQNRVFRLW